MPEKPTAKRYFLSRWDNNMWNRLSKEEAKEFSDKYPEVGKYVLDPLLAERIRIDGISSSVTLYESWDKAAKRIVNHLWKQNGAIVFHEPVDPILFNIPDYLEVIKNPMDFATIKSKLAKYVYKSPSEFIGDVELVFTNCIIYNGENSDYGVIAKGLKEEFRKQCEQLRLDFYA
jgi:hypothetical protein